MSPLFRIKINNLNNILLSILILALINKVVVVSFAMEKYTDL